MEQDPFCEIPGESWAEFQKRFDEYWARKMESLKAMPEEIAQAAAQIHEDCEEVGNHVMSLPKSEREAYIGDAIMEPGFSLELPGFLERQCVNQKSLSGSLSNSA